MDGCVEGCEGCVVMAMLRVGLCGECMDGCVDVYVGSVWTAVLMVMLGVC